MHTKDILAAALRKAGLEAMAADAERGHYHDFLSPLPLPDLQLASDLRAAIRDGNKEAVDILHQHMQGAFDASLEESDEWAESEDGKAAFEMLRAGLKP